MNEFVTLTETQLTPVSKRRGKSELRFQYEIPHKAVKLQMQEKLSDCEFYQ